MNRLGSELLLQSAVNQLMLTDAIETIKSCRHYADLKMITTSREIFDAHLSIW